MKYYLYILFSEKLNKYYVGSTTELDRRVIEHNRGKEKFTRTGLPWLLVYTEDFPSLLEARRREREIKSKKSRKYIEALINAAAG
jgi:putative endonuclease